MGMQEPCQLFSLTLLLLCAAYVLSLIELIVTELHQNIILNYFSQQKWEISNFIFGTLKINCVYLFIQGIKDNLFQLISLKK